MVRKSAGSLKPGETLMHYDKMPENLRRTVDEIRYARIARNVGTPIAVLVGNGFYRHGLSPIEDLKFGLPGSIIAGAATLAATNSIIHDRHVELGRQIREAPELSQGLKGTAPFARVSRNGHLVATDRIPTVGSFRVIIDGDLATKRQLTKYDNRERRVLRRRRALSRVGDAVQLAANVGKRKARRRRK